MKQNLRKINKTRFKTNFQPQITELVICSQKDLFKWLKNQQKIIFLHKSYSLHRITISNIL